jgi:hypothetical protein
MSRFLLGTTQTATSPRALTCGVVDGGLADGIVIGLQDLAIVGSTSQGAGARCNATSIGACSVPTGQIAAAGLAYDGASGASIPAAQRNAAPYLTPPPDGFPSFSIASWRDVLDILYAGFVDPALHPVGSDPEVGKNCASSLRFALANNYGDLFENPSCAGGSVTCTQIEHVFRRDDASGASEIFGALLGLGPTAFYANPVSKTFGNYFLGTDPFCNDLENNTIVAGKIAGAPAASDANAGWGTLWPGSNPPSAVPNDDQDFDPIRRPCIGTNFQKPAEQVCERATFDPLNPVCAGPGTCPVNPQTGVQEQCLGGQCWDATPTLGLLLPILTTSTLGTDVINANLNDQYNLITLPGTPTASTPCCSSQTTINPCTYATQINAGVAVGRNLEGLCPNGDESQTAGGSCWVPVDSNGNPNCWANATPQLCNGGDCTQGVIGKFGGTTGGGPDVRNVDPRVYNLYSYTWAGGGWLINVDDAQQRR